MFVKAIHSFHLRVNLHLVKHIKLATFKNQVSIAVLFTSTMSLIQYRTNRGILNTVCHIKLFQTMWSIPFTTSIFLLQLFCPSLQNPGILCPKILIILSQCGFKIHSTRVFSFNLFFDLTDVEKRASLKCLFLSDYEMKLIARRSLEGEPKSVV